MERAHHTFGEVFREEHALFVYESPGRCTSKEAGLPQWQSPPHTRSLALRLRRTSLLNSNNAVMPTIPREMTSCQFMLFSYTQE